MRSIQLCLIMAAAISVLASDPAPDYVLPAIPKEYHLHEYDDCGVEGRQPHVDMAGSYFFTFSTGDTNAGLRERSAVFNWTAVKAVYTNLDPALSYVLAVTYASDHVYKRVQSLEANGVMLHGPCALPLAKATRVIVRVPPEVSQSGKMALTWKRLGEANATVSIIELWANAPSTNGLGFGFLAGLAQSLEGQVVDAAYHNLPGAQVTLSVPGASGSLTATAGREGTFCFSRSAMEALSPGRDWTLTIQNGGDQCATNLRAANLFFEPVHYRPLPVSTMGLKTNSISLDGAWRINTAPGQDVQRMPLSSPEWHSIKVPGQWLQQGFDIPNDRTVAMAKEFTVPKNWSGRRVILRFDAIHAGTTYWLNGHKLGYSENLFTPVEWDITDAVKLDGVNRLDLEMKVDTLSEQLSISSGYAFHNLGGIDRAVRVFALPPTHIRQLHLDAGLDKDYRDGELRLSAVVEGGGDLELAIELRDAHGKVVHPSVSRLAIGPFTGSKTVELTGQVPAPLPWSAEKPNLYKLAVELRQHGRTLERIERNVGFRTVEIRGRQLYVNGRVVKLAGSCHHETDPLTGRANTVVHAEEDVRLLKEANLNHIRTSHYPPNAELLDAADKLGMYVEVEAPICWNGDVADDAAHKQAVLGPTSRMIDFHHSHPCVIFWSIANESAFNQEFFYSTKMCRQLDATRPTTFNNPDQTGTPYGRVTDIANNHYPAWPYDGGFESDPRPVYLGEYYYEITHEQTDVAVDPGLRELWGFGHAEPDSAFGLALTKEYDLGGGGRPLLRPGGWSFIEHSDHVIGGSIWASLDDAFYFSETKHAGYAWHHGFWGLIDPWRRPKPEWFLARHVFSPVWLQTRHAEFAPGQKSVRVPVENRYAFTDFSELKFSWQINRHKGGLHPRLAPGANGELEIPIPDGTAEGSHMLLRITNRSGQLIDEASVCLGNEKSEVLPEPSAGPPAWSDDGRKIFIQGEGFSFVFDREKGDFDASDPRHTGAVIAFPALHATLYDWGDFRPVAPRYAALPERKSRMFDKIEVRQEGAGLRLTVHDHYQDFAGSTSWLIDKTGQGVVSGDYAYSGPPIDTREAGIRFLLRTGCDEVKWRRWSEWGDTFPAESITRVEGAARAHRSAQWGPARWNARPGWPWSLDETELGTAEFRSVKYNVYDAALAAADGSGLELRAKADADFRAALAPGGVAAHLLWRCPFRETTLNKGNHLRGQFAVQLRRH